MGKKRFTTEEKIQAVELHIREGIGYGSISNRYLNHFDTYEELVAAVEQFIHYYNHQRQQHKLNCLPPATYRSLLEAA